jgi:BirA family transcriptional regulator, biotin operon repressor / biotin---[acetyl-CoA-carboxylase] ligase
MYNHPTPGSEPSIGATLILLPAVDSTNNYAMQQAQDGLAAHGDAWFAEEQYAGQSLGIGSG